MAENGISIDITEMGDIAVDMKSVRSAIKEELEAIQTEMKSVSNLWKGSAQRELESKYSKIMKKTEAFDKDLKAYAEFVLTTAESFDYVEKNINNNADLFE